MKQTLLTLAGVLLLHTAQAQLLKNLKDRAAGAVQAATGMSVGGGRNASRDGDTGSAAGSGEAAAAKPVITFSTAAGGAAATRFAPTDNIYARVPLPGTLQELLTAQEIEPDKQDGKLYLPVGIRIADGQGHGYESLSIVVAPQDLGKRELLLDILPAKGAAKTAYRVSNDDARPVSSVFLSVGGNYIDYGNHTYLLSIGRADNLYGLFEMSIPDKATASGLAKRIEADRQLLDRQLAFATALPAIFREPKGKFADPALSDAAIRRLLGPDVIRYVITGGDADYHVVRNDLGVPLRKASRDVWAIYKDKDGMCGYSRFQFVRQHEGGGKYGPPSMVQFNLDNKVLACENVK